MAETFPQRLKRIREIRDLNQLDLAKKTGLQQTAVSHFETGARAPSFDNLRRLADALQVSTDYLMGRSEETSLAGPQADSLFRDVEKLSSEDLDVLRMMKEAMLKKKGGLDDFDAEGKRNPPVRSTNCEREWICVFAD